MRQGNTVPQAPSGETRYGYQPVGKGHQPTRALNSTPPQGGSGVPSPAPATPAAAPSPASSATPSGGRQGSRG